MYVWGKLFGKICHLLLAGESLLKKDMHAAMDKNRQHTGRRKGEKIELLSLMPLCYPLPTQITFFWIQKRNIIHSSYIMLCCAKSLQRVYRLFETLQTVAHQAPLFKGFFRQEYWSGFLSPTPGDLPDPGTEPSSLVSPALAGGFFTTELLGSPQLCNQRANKRLDLELSKLIDNWYNIPCINVTFQL